MSYELQVVVGKRIREKREKKSLTQDQLAHRVQMSRTSLTNIELGRQRLLIDQLYKMAAALNIKPHDLLPLPSDLACVGGVSQDPIPDSVHRFAALVRSQK